jgi:hypothetical protein
MTPEDDADLSRCWSAWLVAREVGDADWRKYALNQLRIALERCIVNDGGTLVVATDILDVT